MMASPLLPALAPIAAGAATLPATLTALVDELWRHIAQGLGGGWPPWALPTLATVGEDGPRSRVLALRCVDARSRRLEFHGDARSDKVREIGIDPRVSVAFWDPGDAIEARLCGAAAVHCGDGVARAAWQRVSPLRRMACAIDGAPGDELAAAKRFDELPASADSEVAFQRFAVIAVEVAAIDWVWLGQRDMRRARFRWTGADWYGGWAIP